MGKVVKLFVGLIIVMIVGIIGITALSNAEGVIGDTTNAAKNTVANIALDASGLKNRVQDALESRVNQISAATGLPISTVEQGISNLAVQDWEVATLPDSVTATGTFSGSAAGVNGTITTYDDPSYVTVNAYGQNVTLEVPSSAQQYLVYLQYLG
ncbi:MAG: hypothetical protein U0L71_00555 [Eggerthellaceae bacterium]|nr:hypothetical protein [Eggerthellaceae bacterium]